MAASHGDRDFSKGLQWSILAHGILFVFLVIKTTVFPSKPIPYFPSLRVDLVALPDILKKDLSRMTLSPEVPEMKGEDTEALKARPKPTAKEVEKAKPSEMVYKPKAQDVMKRRSKMKGAIDRIKSLNKILAEGETPAPTVVKGNRLSKGASLSGEAREAAMGSYYDTLRDHLQMNWALPVWLSRQNYAAQVQVFVDGRGRLHHFKFIKLSSNAQFDEAVKRTLIGADPYPLPPADLGRTLLMDGILVGFPL